MADDDQAPTRRVISAELVIATFALLASAIASIATIFQTRTIGNQLSASVWPYLTAAATLVRPAADGSGRLSLSYTNEGLGPALIRTFVVNVDGRPARNWSAVLAREKSGDSLREGSERDFGGDSVIRPGETLAIVSFNVPKRFDAQLLQSDIARFSSTVCFCSLLRNCWTLETRQTEPTPVPTCGLPTPPVTQ